MEKEYDLFERAQDHALLWRGRVYGLENARRKLEQLAQKTTNECSVIYQPTPQVVALANIAQTKRVVFHVAYDEGELAQRAELLQLRGYEVVSASGNGRAKVVLSLPQRVDLFMVGHGEPEEMRREIVAWLKHSYPKTPILALNSAENQQLAGRITTRRSMGRWRGCRWWTRRWDETRGEDAFFFKDLSGGFGGGGHGVVYGDDGAINFILDGAIGKKCAVGNGRLCGR